MAELLHSLSQNVSQSPQQFDGDRYRARENSYTRPSVTELFVTWARGPARVWGRARAFVRVCERRGTWALARIFRPNFKRFRCNALFSSFTSKPSLARVLWTY